MRQIFISNNYPLQIKLTGPPHMKSKIKQLIEIVEDLRHPETGCPWDKEQTFETIAPYTIEEAYEVFDAIKNKDPDSLKDELGDLLFQIVFYAQMSKEKGGYDFEDIAQEIANKMVQRHPHVFENTRSLTLEDQTMAWENQKAFERSDNLDQNGALDGVALALPALIRAQKLQKRAARVGFDWQDIEPVMKKIREELDEVTDALNSQANIDHIAEEIGDLLFSCVNLARHTKIDAEQALMAANDKFQQRFQFIELLLNDRGKNVEECSLEELEKFWNEAKSKESTLKGGLVAS